MSKVSVFVVHVTVLPATSVPLSFFVTVVSALSAVAVTVVVAVVMFAE